MNNPNKINKGWNDDWFGRIIGATILISLGIIFLLNTTGILPWAFWGNFWSIAWRLWPFFLIFAGIQIIIGKHKVFNLVSGIIFALLLAAIALISVLASIPSLGVKDTLNSTFPGLFVNQIDTSEADNSTELSE
jgi:hypothetical protein